MLPTAPIDRVIGHVRFKPSCPSIGSLLALGVACFATTVGLGCRKPI